MSFSLKALEYEQVDRLVGLLNKQLPLHGSGNFPTLEVFIVINKRALTLVQADSFLLYFLFL